jgi:hypothetical protein
MNNLYRAGWRPAAGWVCVAGLANGLLVLPWCNVALALVGRGPVIGVDVAMLMALLGSVGMGALRSYDKTRGNP